MGLLSWIILGLIAGLIADFLMGGGVGLLGSIILGIVGAVIGGWLAAQLGFGSGTRAENRSNAVPPTAARNLPFVDHEAAGVQPRDPAEPRLRPPPTTPTGAHNAGTPA